jgi:transcriptional regulator with XRE-family HTH domain
MEEQERALILSRLQGLRTGGRLVVRPWNKEMIGDVFAPLPPPWEWEYLREIAGFSAADMERRTGFSSMRIRSWEKGFGTLSPELWVEYAEHLADAVVTELKDRENGSLLGIADGRITVRLNDGVTAQLDQLHSTVMSLSIWSDGNGSDTLPRCSPGEAVAVRKALREAVTALRTVHSRLRPIAVGTGKGREERQ